MNSQNLFQIFLSEELLEPPEIFQEKSRLFQRFFPTHAYRCWNKIDLREFIGDCFPADVLSAYDSLRPLAFKCDLARYCLAYHFGGWYADISLMLLRGIELPEKTELLYFYDLGQTLPSPDKCGHNCMNAFFFASKGSAVMSDAVEMIVRHCQERFYGMSALEPTGPTLFGRCIARYAPRPSMIHGHFMSLTPYHMNKNQMFISQAGVLLAAFKTSWMGSIGIKGFTDMGTMNIPGSNSYNKLWKARRIYGE